MRDRFYLFYSISVIRNVRSAMRLGVGQSFGAKASFSFQVAIYLNLGNFFVL